MYGVGVGDNHKGKGQKIKKSTQGWSEGTTKRSVATWGEMRKTRDTPLLTAEQRRPRGRTHCLLHVVPGEHQRLPLVALNQPTKPLLLALIRNHSLETTP
jgi:hypothetical protein